MARLKKSENVCKVCGQIGHYANTPDCPQFKGSEGESKKNAPKINVDVPSGFDRAAFFAMLEEEAKNGNEDFGKMLATLKVFDMNGGAAEMFYRHLRGLGKIREKRVISYEYVNVSPKVETPTIRPVMRLHTFEAGDTVKMDGNPGTFIVLGSMDNEPNTVRVRAEGSEKEERVSFRTLSLVPIEEPKIEEPKIEEPPVKKIRK